MLTRRLCFNRQRPSPLLRSVSTSATFQRSPSLADITPDGAHAFDSHQVAFREQLKQAQRAKEKQDSQSVTASKSPVSSSSSVAGSTLTAPQASNASLPPDSHGNLAIGSLSMHDAGAARESSLKEESHKRKGALSSLIYGTHEGRQMDQDIEKSFSQVLARGKYVHSIVFHSVKPDKVDEYVDLVGGWYSRMANIRENHVNLVGSWRTEVGDCDTFGETDMRPV